MINANESSKNAWIKQLSVRTILTSGGVCIRFYKAVHSHFMDAPRMTKTWLQKQRWHRPDLTTKIAVSPPEEALHMTTAEWKIVKNLCNVKTRRIYTHILYTADHCILHCIGIKLSRLHPRNASCTHEFTSFQKLHSFSHWLFGVYLNCDRFGLKFKVSPDSAAFHAKLLFQQTARNYSVEFSELLTPLFAESCTLEVEVSSTPWSLGYIEITLIQSKA